MEMTINEILLFALVQKEYARTEYFKLKQRESGISQDVFSMLLLDACQYYHDRIHENDWRILDRSANVSTSLPIWIESGGKFGKNGHIGDVEILALLENIKAAFPPPNKEIHEEKLISIFKGEKEFKVCMELFEEMEITLNGRNQLQKGNGYKLFGALVAIKSFPLLKKDKMPEKELLTHFNKHLNTKYAYPFNKKSRQYREYLDDAERVLKRLLKNSR